MTTTETELQILATKLDIPPADLAFLAEIEAKHIHFLHTSITQAAQSKQQALWASLGRATALLPLPALLIAKMTENLFGAYVIANAMYHMPPAKVISISKHLSIPYLAEVMENMIPEKSPPFLNIFPAERLLQIIDYQLQQEAYSMGIFLNYMPIDLALLALNHIDSPTTVLRTLAFSQPTAHIATLVMRLSDTKILGLLKTAVSLSDWLLLLSIAQACTTPQQMRLITLFQRLPNLAQTPAIEAAEQLGVTYLLQWETRP